MVALLCLSIDTHHKGMCILALGAVRVFAQTMTATQGPKKGAADILTIKVAGVQMFVTIVMPACDPPRREVFTITTVPAAGDHMKEVFIHEIITSLAMVNTHARTHAL